MATINNLFRNLFRVKNVSFKNYRIEQSEDGIKSLYIEAILHKKADNRCPVCGRRCKVYDSEKHKRK